jgi:hypothetical protein
LLFLLLGLDLIPLHSSSCLHLKLFLDSSILECGFFFAVCGVFLCCCFSVLLLCVEDCPSAKDSLRLFSKVFGDGVREEAEAEPVRCRRRRKRNHEDKD